jgi:hypothetical protein
VKSKLKRGCTDIQELRYADQYTFSTRIGAEGEYNAVFEAEGKLILSTALHSPMKMPNTIRVVITNQEYLGYFLSDHSGKPNESSAMFNRK